ncbi:MAG: AI-2E family transporter [Treponema sp.]|nr:AI-2E family transporter [Treponema sp.]
MSEKNYTRASFFVLLFFACVLAGALCKTMSSFILPVVVSLMLSFVFLPIIKKMNAKLKLPWTISSILVILLFLFAFFGISSLLVSGLSSIVYEYPKYESKFLNVYKLIAENLNLEFDAGESFITNLFKNLEVQKYAQKTAVFLSSGIVSFGKSLFLITIMVIFIEIEMNLTKEKLHRAFTSDKEKFSRISHQIVNDTVRYVSIKFYISLATGLLVFLATWLTGMDFPIVWAFIAFIMNFIPVFGSIISVGITTIFALLQFSPSFAKPIFILFFLTAINLTLGNIIEPRIEGKNLGLSPFAILVSLSLWGYIWGFLGMILAVPLTVIIKIVCENIDDLRWIATILGNGDNHSASKS